MAAAGWLSIGEVAERTGLSVSAIRFYESAGLVFPRRNSGGQRRFHRADKRTPTQRDWNRLSRGFRDELQARIDILTRMRNRLDGCIGCGCLSLTNCALYNADDRARRQGTGPRYLLGEPE
ncbi:MAG: MerR family DNA-binding transcriptional regulator [Gammaproteobacteria bacterium]|nr:MAG: MerR family DNA-binding transcriptional regulator [Gammaproteobacteria bacterium]